MATRSKPVATSSSTPARPSSAFLRALAAIGAVLVGLAPAGADGQDAPPVAPLPFAPPPVAVDELVVDAPEEPPAVGAPSVGDRVGADPMEVPASVAVVDRARLRTEAIVDFRAALERVPGVMPIFEYGGFQFLTVRGFQDFLVLHDGHRDDRSTIAQSAPQGGLYDVERIEVLRGPASVLYGYGALGGVINMVYRAPQPVAAYDGELGIGSQGQRRLRVGATGPTFHRSLTYRVDAGHSTRDDFRGLATRQDGVSLTLDYEPVANHRLRFRAGVVDDHYSTDTGIPTVDGRIPDGVDRGNRYNTPQDFMQYRRYDIAFDYSLRIAPGIEVRNRFAFSRDHYAYFSTESLAVAANGTEVERGYFYLDRHWFPWSDQLELHAEVGDRVRQKIAAGYELGLLRSRHPRSDVFDTPVAPLDLRNPGVDPQPEVEIDIVALDRRDQVTHSVYAHDHASLPFGFSLVGGVRLDVFQRTIRRDTIDPATQVTTRGAETDFRDVAVTYRGGIVYRPAPWTSTYASFATAFRPSTVVPVDGRLLDPEQGWQAEVGQRFEQSIVRADLALFELHKFDVAVSRGMGVYAQAGSQRSRGVEGSVDLRFLEQLSFRAAYAYVHARYHRFVDDGVDYTGNTPRIVPAHSGNAWLMSHPVSGLDVGVGVRGVSHLFADDSNTVRMPGYALVDAVVAYTRWGLRGQINLRNLGNQQRYIASAINGTQLTPGAPFEVLATVGFDR